MAWEPGEIKAVAYRDGKAAASTKPSTPSAPAVALRLTPITGPGGLQADGSDVALIDVEAVDANGDRCPTFQQRVDFDIDGPGVWRGGYNSGKTNSINNRFLDLECGINRVAVRSTARPAHITVTAHCGDLKPATPGHQQLLVSVDHGFMRGTARLAAAAASEQELSSEDLLIASQSKVPIAGRFLKAFSYSGPAAAVRVREDAQAGAKIYADRDFVFTDLPAALAGSDWVQTANADKLYSAVDLMELPRAWTGWSMWPTTALAPPGLAPKLHPPLARR